ncbi:putative uncharacterized protein [Clostridium sp. CAG:411]|jgi:hypothetical protein|nr:hypothetical protein [Lachnospiraceae bacterium]CDE42161.1 putative uncharacterized protein [Clostridium sp. CAG:411]
MINTILNFTNKNDILDKCIYASIKNAVMSGAYPSLSEEIAWDGNNYLFQNMEGIRGVIAFSNDIFVCGVRNEKKYEEGRENIFFKLLNSASEKVLKLAEEELLPYFLVESENENIPALSMIFWGENDMILSCVNESEVMERSEFSLLPYVYNFNDLEKYWIDCYEPNKEQLVLVNQIFQKRLVCNKFRLSNNQKEKLINWFGDNVEYCEERFNEIGIGIPDL